MDGITLDEASALLNQPAPKPPSEPPKLGAGSRPLTLDQANHVLSAHSTPVTTDYTSAVGDYAKDVGVVLSRVAKKVAEAFPDYSSSVIARELVPSTKTDFLPHELEKQSDAQDALIGGAWKGVINLADDTARLALEGVTGLFEGGLAVKDGDFKNVLPSFTRGAQDGDRQMDYVNHFINKVYAVADHLDKQEPVDIKTSDILKMDPNDRPMWFDPQNPDYRPGGDIPAKGEAIDKFQVTRAERATNDLVGLIPKGLTAFGDTTAEQSARALRAAGFDEAAVVVSSFLGSAAQVVGPGAILGLGGKILAKGIKGIAEGREGTPEQTRFSDITFKRLENMQDTAPATFDVLKKLVYAEDPKIAGLLTFDGDAKASGHEEAALIVGKDVPEEKGPSEPPTITPAPPTTDALGSHIANTATEMHTGLTGLLSGAEPDVPKYPEVPLTDPEDSLTQYNPTSIGQLDHWKTEMLGHFEDALLQGKLDNDEHMMLEGEIMSLHQAKLADLQKAGTQTFSIAPDSYGKYPGGKMDVSEYTELVQGINAGLQVKGTDKKSLFNAITQAQKEFYGDMYAAYNADINPLASLEINLSGKMVDGLPIEAEFPIVSGAHKIGIEYIKTQYNNGYLSPQQAVSNAFSLYKTLAHISGTYFPPVTDEKAVKIIDAAEAGTLKKIAPALGSNPGGVYQDSNGLKYYVKQYPDPEQIKQEVLAASVYQNLGIQTLLPSYQMIDGTLSVVTEWDPKVKPLTEPDIKSIHGSGKSKPKDTLARMFVAAILTKNWDAVGLYYDNIGVYYQEGLHLVAMDLGGTFQFRAQGGGKPYDHEITELNSLRDPAINPSAAKVFGPLWDDPGAIETMLNTLDGQKLGGIKQSMYNQYQEHFWPAFAAKWQALYEALSKRNFDLQLAETGDPKLQSNTIIPVAKRYYSKDDIKYNPHKVPKWLRQNNFKLVPPALHGYTKKPLNKGKILNSQGEFVAPELAHRKNFREWATKKPNHVVTDETGKPLLLFHSTSYDIDIWKNQASQFMCFTTSLDWALDWAGDKIYPVMIRADTIADFRDPKDVQKVINWYASHPKHFGGAPSLEEIKLGRWTAWENTDMWDHYGWNGVMMRESTYSKYINIAVRKEGHNVKSASANKGTYGEVDDPTLMAGETKLKPHLGITTLAQAQAANRAWNFFKASPNVVWVEEQLIEAWHDGDSMSAHEVLDAFMREDSPFYDSFAALRESVDDVRIIPVMGADIVLRDGTRYSSETAIGIYDPTTHEIHVRVDAQFMPQLAYVIHHELWHAGTVKLLYAFEHGDADPATNKLAMELLRSKTKVDSRVKKFIKELDKLDIPSRQVQYDPKDVLYGMKNVLEFVAEVMSNPRFQWLIAKTERYRHELVKIEADLDTEYNDLLKLHGLDPKEQTLLKALLKLAHKLLKAQRVFLDSGKPQKPVVQPAAMKNFHSGIPINTEGIKQAFTYIKEGLVSTKVGKAAVGKLEEFYERALQTYNPEAFGPAAKQAAAALAKNMHIQASREMVVWQQSKARREWWLKQGPDKAKEFLKRFESGQAQPTADLQTVAKFYKAWNSDIYSRDIRNGILYNEKDNYIMHIFKPNDRLKAMQFLKDKYGPKFGDPGFTKDRTFEMYEEAVRAGFEPLYTNPEDIMLARERASLIAETRVNTLAQLEKWGLARKVNKGSKSPPKGFPANRRRSPNGINYWVDKTADAVLHNAWDSEGLWENPDIKGQVFRTYMGIKNNVIPIKLSLSLFHPMHVLGIDMAANLTAATKEALGTPSTESIGQLVLKFGEMNPGSALYRVLWTNPRSGSRLFNMFRGKIPFSEWTAEDKALWQYFTESGMIPTRPAEETTGAIQKFRDAVIKRSLTAPIKLIPAIIQGMGHPIYGVWIPELKIAALMKDIQTAIKLDPELLNDPKRRAVVFRALARKVEGRYGEMNYQTMFMDKFYKDIGTGLTLSLGWQLGFIDQYGGGSIDAVKALGGGGNFRDRVKSGGLDRPIFMIYYLALGLAFGALVTKLFTGDNPQDMLDYTHPRVGGTDDNGKPSRVNTMFYTREFAALYKHMVDEGTVEGVSDFVLSKGAGVIEMGREAIMGVDGLGREIWDPYGTPFQKVEQAVAAELAGLDPIALQSLDKGSKAVALGVAGLAPAGQFMTDSHVEAKIKQAYHKYVDPKIIAYDTAAKSADMKKLRATANSGGDYQPQLDAIVKKYGLTGKQEADLQKGLFKPDVSPTARMFQRLPWSQQKQILKFMSPEEREQYAPFLPRERRAEVEE